MDRSVAISSKFRFRNLVLFTTLPALLVGALLWLLADALPTCSIIERARLTAPDATFDLVVFARTCGPDTDPNTQAALIPAGAALADDAVSFLSIGADANLAPRWDGFGNIELTVPVAAKIHRQDDAVAGIAVIYR